MTSYYALRDWFDKLDAKAYAGVMLVVGCVLASAVFGIIPNNNLLVVNAFLSGSVWMICVGVLIFGGKRVDILSSCACAMIAAGLTTSIPSIFWEHTPVDWGSTLSRTGFLLIMVRFAHDLYERVRLAKERE